LIFCEQLLPVDRFSSRSCLPQGRVLGVLEHLGHVVARAVTKFFQRRFERHRARSPETRPNYLYRVLLSVGDYAPLLIQSKLIMVALRRRGPHMIKSNLKANAALAFLPSQPLPL
jgi:hypothetical protein